MTLVKIYDKPDIHSDYRHHEQYRKTLDYPERSSNILQLDSAVLLHDGYSTLFSLENSDDTLPSLGKGGWMRPSY
jgi:hypothetical protein